MPDLQDHSDSTPETLNSETLKSKQTIIQDLLDRYWRRNLRLMGLLIFIWAFVSLICGVLIADWLNQVNLPGTGYPLGFWFAQQGSIIIFVLLILVYCVFMNRLDRQHHEDLMQLNGERGEQ